MKYALCFLGGSIFSALAVVLASGRPALMLVLGFALAIGTVAASVWLMGISRTVRVLNALSTKAAAVEPARRMIAATQHEAKTKAWWNDHKPHPIDKSAYRKPSDKQRDQILQDTIDEYLEPESLTPPARRAS